MDTFAFGSAEASPLAQGNTSGRTSAHGNPANCFRVGWDGKIEEGIFLDFDHPSARMKTALILGGSGRYVGANTKPERAPKLEDAGSRYLMRRAFLNEITIEGKRPFYVFNRLDTSVLPYVLVHVDCDTPRAVTLKDPLLAGISGDYGEVGMSNFESLIRLDEEHSELRIFFADSRVGIVMYEGPGVAPSFNYIQKREDLLVARLNFLERKLEDTKWITDAEMKVRATDRLFHELARMLELCGSSEPMRRQIMSSIEQLFGYYQPSNGPRTRLKGILASLGDHTIYEWFFAQSDSDNVVDLRSFAPSGRKGPPAERLKQLADRRTTDAKTRIEMRGTSSGGGQKQGKKSGKK